MNLSSSLLLVFPIVVHVGCGAGAQPPAESQIDTSPKASVVSAPPDDGLSRKPIPPRRSTSEDMSPDERGVRAMEELATNLEKVEGNCDGAALVMETFYEENRELLRSLEEQGTSDEEKRAFQATYGQRMEKAMATLLRVGLACAANERFQKAMDPRN